MKMLKKDLDLAREIDEIKNNHLKHIQEDIDRLDKKVSAMDNRLWWVLALLVGATLIPFITQ
jgi:hypothetical protein